MDTSKLYYCSAGGHYWYYSEDGEPKFYANVGDTNNVTDEQAENAEDKYCGCNEH